MTVSHALMPTIGIDVGGTFTDFVAVMPDGSLMFHKQPSTPDDPSLAVSEGLGTLLRRHSAFDGGTIRIVHGTTLPLNAILQHKVADVALVVSRGHRDVLEIGRAKLRTPYNIHLNKEQPVVPRRHIFEMDARIAADGSISNQPDAAAIDALTATIAASGVAGAVAIMLLEFLCLASAGGRGRRSHPGKRLARPAGLTCSAEIWPEMREFERAVVACINAQIHPLMEDYLAQLGGRVERATRAVLQLTSSSGGMLGLASANQRPIDALSGPASGATAAAKLCKAAGMKAALSFDMGGTSAGASRDRHRRRGRVHHRCADRRPAADDAGRRRVQHRRGRRLDRFGWMRLYGVIKVGPESAGARPGPVAYGLGGTQPTVTDCYLVLGFIDPDRFLGGTMPLDADRATRTLAEGRDAPRTAPTAATCRGGGAAGRHRAHGLGVVSSYWRRKVTSHPGMCSSRSAAPAPPMR